MYHCLHGSTRLAKNIRKLLLLCIASSIGMHCFATARSDEYVLLQNGNVIQGTAVSAGPSVLIRSGGGNELKLASSQVAFSAATLGELYNFRVATRATNDLSSHHDDARWCLRNGLFAQMSEALDAAEVVDPAHPETLRLRRQWQAAVSGAIAKQMVENPGHEGSSHAAATADPSPAPAADVPADRIDDEFAGVGVSRQALTYFTTRVQPILINRCGNSGCHRSPTDSSWNLTHLGAHSRPSARMTRLNLVATLALMDHAQPSQSELLQYAVHAHAGRREPPLRSSDDVAIDSLRQWVALVSLEESADWSAPQGAPLEVSFNAAGIHAGLSGPPPAPSAATEPTLRQSNYLQQQSAASSLAVRSRRAPAAIDAEPLRPVRLPPINDPFDPDIFNRNYRKASPPDHGH